MGTALLAGGLAFAPALPVLPAATVAAKPDGSQLVISQVYGGGGNANATYTHDFIEIFNPTDHAIDLTGRSLQYASATGTGNFGANASQLTELPSASVPAGGYVLVQQATNAAVGSPLPTPDVTDPTPISMAAAAGKVALVDGFASLGCNGSAGQPCDGAALARILDLVGYGTGASGANFFEGAGAAPTLSSTQAAFRDDGGCTDTDDNAADFTAALPNPRNSATPPQTCATGGVTLSVNDVSLAEGDAGTTAFSFTVSLSGPAPEGGVTFDVATDGDSATAPDDYSTVSLTGQTIAAGASTAGFTVHVNGDATEEPDETFFFNVTNVAGTGVTVADGQGVGTILNDDTNVCAAPFQPIYSIQGSGLSAAITGNVTTQGVVVGDFGGSTSTGLEGFYLQDPVGDGNAATSDGIFVYTGSADLVHAGDVVRVTGFARERFDQTTINGSNSNTAAVPAANIVNCGTGAVGPTDVTMPFADANFPERYEGMLVRFPQSLVISEYFNYERFGEMVLALPLAGESRAFTPTAIDEPGAPAQARALANSLRRITLDDGLGVQNPSSVRHPNGAPFSLSNRFRGGDTVADTVGVLGFDFSLYRIQPTAPAEYTAVNPRPAAPEPTGGTLHAAAMNTLNYFLTLDYPTGNPLDNKCGPLQNVECRGADFDQPTELTRQRDKLIAALAGLDADIIGLNELENTPGVDPAADLVAGLNARTGGDTYAAITTGVIGTDAIRVGLIYKPAEVTPIGPFKTLTTAVDPRFIDTKNRPTLAQTFQDNDTGARFTVAVNHLKSKGSDCNDVGDPDILDGQGNCNVTRTNAARALVDWLATDPTGSGDPDFLILGDLNSYAKEDPVDAVLAGHDDVAGTADDYTNLIAQYQGLYAYSYVFDGQAGYLDHALASATMESQVVGAEDWHIDADEPDILDYDTSFKPPAQDALYEPNASRVSDHDPVLVGLDLERPEAQVGLAPDPCAAGGQALMIVGTTRPDHISVVKLPRSVEVRVDGATVGTFATPGRVIVRAGDGDDTVEIDARLETPLLADGEGGNDRISSGNGIGVLSGGDGNDWLSSGKGRDIVLGGRGVDTVDGGNGEDVVSGLRTGLDAPSPSVQATRCAVAAEWGREDVTFATRVAALQSAFAPLADDGAVDQLFGRSGLDWFLATATDTTDRAGAETLTTP
jgi:predicted extracellular nuclease